MSEMGPPCEKCGHASGFHAASHCPYSFGDGQGSCDCSGYVPMGGDRFREALRAIAEKHRVTNDGEWCAEDGFAWPCFTARTVKAALDDAG